MKLFLSLLLILPLPAEDHPGKLPFQTHCAACHMKDVLVVGPSLVEVAKTYPEKKKTDFIAWAKAPGRKNQKLIQMPSMAHVPDVDLAKIHDYVLQSTKGFKEKKRSTLFKNFKEPKRDLPYITRSSMPDSSPASIAVVLENNMSICWDTETCRFRYAYEGNRTNLFSMWSPASLPNQPYYTEAEIPLVEHKGEPKFLGYQLYKKNPEFHYRIGDLEVKELIANGKEQNAFTRQIQITNLTDSISLNLEGKGKAILNSDQGILKNGKLTLTADEAKLFTLKVTRK